jgi:hypothetical protein
VASWRFLAGKRFWGGYYGPNPRAVTRHFRRLFCAATANAGFGNAEYGAVVK